MAKKQVMVKEAEPDTTDYTPVKTENEPRILTVNGQPIPIHLQHAIPFANTDQGIEESNIGKSAPSGVKVTSDAWDRKLESRANGDREAWESSDPISEVVDPIRVPGMGYRLLSDNVRKRRGMAGWVADKRPNGDLVKVGNMFVGHMPIEKVEQRNNHYREIGNEDLKNLQAKSVENQERAIRDSGVEGITSLRPGEIMHDTEGPTSGIAIGSSRTRGRLPQGQ